MMLVYPIVNERFFLIAYYTYRILDKTLIKCINARMVIAFNSQVSWNFHTYIFLYMYMYLWLSYLKVYLYDNHNSLLRVVWTFNLLYIACTCTCINWKKCLNVQIHVYKCTYPTFVHVLFHVHVFSMVSFSLYKYIVLS